MIEVQNLSWKAPQKKENSLGPLSFEIHAGEIFGIVGPKGSGKSTLQKILVGIHRDYTGDVFFEKKELKDWSRDFYEVVGTVLPNPPATHFPKLTVTESLTFMGALYRGEMENVPELLNQVGLQDEAQTRINQLTPGMQARLSLARALMHQPSVLFFYEPVRFIEIEKMELIKALILQQKTLNRTVVLLTQEAGLAETLCDRVAILNHGKMESIRSSKEAD